MVSDSCPSTSVDIDPLTALAIKHGTDKWGLHFYTPIYHALFAHLRDTPIRLLEIGVGGYGYSTVGGASLKMWAEYFSQARIFGLDISRKTLALDPRVTLLVGSQDDREFLKRLTDEHGPFDIIIDDGSHQPLHVSASFYALFPRLADGGLYVIEDVQTAFWPAFGGSIIDGGVTMKLALSVLEYLNHAEISVERPATQIPNFARKIRSLRAYHNLLVIEKGDNSEPSNHAYRLDNPHAEHAVRTIEQELARAPTPEGIANLADVLNAAQQYSRAENILADALARWPDNSALLHSMANLAQGRGDTRTNLAFLERILAREPDNATLRRLCENTRSKLPPGAI
jgi:tetratricopeptide (TPR) repeat protein